MNTFSTRFPEMVGHIGTHYEGCFKHHAACAYAIGFSDGAYCAQVTAFDEEQPRIKKPSRKEEEQDNGISEHG